MPRPRPSLAKRHQAHHKPTGHRQLRVYACCSAARAFFTLLRPETRTLVDHIFDTRAGPEPRIDLPLELPLQGSATVEDHRECYGIELNAAGRATLDEILYDRLGGDPQAGTWWTSGWSA
jgi:hypothetical protein